MELELNEEEVNDVLNGLLAWSRAAKMYEVEENDYDGVIEVKMRVKKLIRKVQRLHEQFGRNKEGEKE